MRPGIHWDFGSDRTAGKTKLFPMIAVLFLFYFYEEKNKK
jgi:hypothetical protein